MSSDLVLASDQSAFTSNQVAVLKQLGVDNASQSDLAVFFHQCKRTGLDPFTKQIYMIGRWDSRSNSMKQTIQVGIDGCRLVADRTGAYLGSDESWQERDGQLVSATVNVRKLVSGQVGTFTAIARFDEYAQYKKDGKLMGLWGNMPHRMLAKCAEALALRKAFPQDLSGLYTTEEMSQADTPVQHVEVSHTVPVDPDPLVSAENVARFEQACENAMLDWEWVTKDAGLDGLVGLRESGRVKLLASFNKLKAAKPANTVTDNLDLVKEIVDTFTEPVPTTALFASAKQVAAIKALLRSQEISSTVNQLEAAGNGVGRVVDSWAELTGDEATLLIGTLGKSNLA